MPARSQAQQRFMAMCEHAPQHVKGRCPDMTHAQLRAFAATPRTGLPARVKPVKHPTLMDALMRRHGGH